MMSIMLKLVLTEAESSLKRTVLSAARRELGVVRHINELVAARIGPIHPSLQNRAR